MKDSFRFTNEYLFCLFQLVGTMVFLKLNDPCPKQLICDQLISGWLTIPKFTSGCFSKKCMHRFVEGFD